MVNPKQKGAGGEREACTLLGSILTEGGVSASGIERNLNQTREGGGDILAIPGLVIEVKRCETLNVPMWWRQVCRAADRNGDTPVLMYRQNRKPWQFCLPSYLLVIGAKGYLTLGEPDFRVWLHRWVS